MTKPTDHDDDKETDTVVDDALRQADAIVDDALRQALSLSAPSTFADRVLAARAAAQTPARRPTRILAVAAAIAVVVGGSFAAGRLSPRPGSDGVVAAASGSLSATARTTTAVPGALIVAEPGARLSWADGGVTVSAGEAFFRVEAHDQTSPFIVHTPGGDVVVHGTCFRVRVSGESPMSVLSQSRLPSAVLGTVVGAVAASAITLVLVDEGLVTLKNAHGAVAVAAGEQAQASSSTSPEKRQGDPRAQLAERRLQTTLASLAAADAARAGDLQQLVAENQRLRAVVAAQDEELSLVDVDRKVKEGEARPFPDDLPPRFTETALRAAFEDAITQAGVEAQVTRIDCSEYPCMVWGTWAGDTRALADTLKGTEAYAGYADDDNRVFGWGMGDGPEVFAVALTPKRAEGAPPDESLNRRTSYRARDQFETLRAERQAAARP